MNASNASIIANATIAVVPSIDSSQPWYPYVFVSYLIEMLAVLGGNVLVVIAYLTTPQLQTPPCLLIFNLSLIDCAIPFFTFPWFFYTYTDTGLMYVTRNKWACLTSIWTTAFTSTSSMMAIFFLSVDRFLAILCPYSYYNMVTEKSVKIANVFAWGFPAGLLAIPFFDFMNIWMPGRECVSMYVYNPMYNSFVLSITRAAILISCAVMNAAVAMVAFKKSRVVFANPSSDQAANIPLAIEFKLTKMLLTVVGTFFITWAPYIALTVYYTMRRGQVSTMVSAAQDFSIVGVGINSVVNPLIYARKNENFRAAFKKILFRNRVDLKLPQRISHKW